MDSLIQMIIENYVIQNAISLITSGNSHLMKRPESYEPEKLTEGTSKYSVPLISPDGNFYLIHSERKLK